MTTDYKPNTIDIGSRPDTERTVKGFNGQAGIFHRADNIQ